MKYRPRLELRKPIFTPRAGALLALLAGCAAFAHAAKGPSAPRKGPVLECKEQRCDFGYQRPGVPVTLTHDFIFTNKGGQPLRILSIGDVCRTHTICQKRKIAPGESGTIRLKTGLDGIYVAEGPFVRQVMIETNDPERPKIELWVEATFGYTLGWEPLAVHCGALKKEQPAGGQTLRLEGKTTETFRVVSFRSLKGLCDVSLTSWTLAKGNVSVPAALTEPSPELHKACWNVRVKPEALVAGPFSDIVEICTDRADIPRIEIPVDGEVEGQVAVEPSEVFLGIVRGTAAVEKEVLVRANGSGAKLKAVHCDIEGLSAKAEPVAEGWRVKLRMEPTGREEPVEGKLTIDMNGVEGGELTVPVRGLLKPQMKAARR